MQALLAGIIVSLAEKIGSALFKALTKVFENAKRKKEISKKVDHALEMEDKAKRSKAIADLLSGK